jgi:hypothetical protein
MKRHKLTGDLPGQQTREQVQAAAQAKAAVARPVESKVVQVSASRLDGDPARDDEKREAQERAARLIAERSAPASDQQVEIKPPAPLAVREKRKALDDDCPDCGHSAESHRNRVMCAGDVAGEVCYCIQTSTSRPFFSQLEQLVPLRAATPESAVLTPLIDWLETHGPDWTQAESERWFKALAHTVELVYPAKAAVS